MLSPERVDLVAIGNDRAVWLKTFWPATGWTSWSSLGGEAAGDISCCWNGPQFNIFTLGINGRCYQNSWTSDGWSGWVDQGSPEGGLKEGVASTVRYIET